MYKLFVITDPTPWIDQIIRTAKIMVDRCGGTSVEFIINNMLGGLGKPNHLILAACEEGKPETLIGWVNAVSVHDTHSPWVELWALWIQPGLGKEMIDLGLPTMIEWASSRNATKIVAILTRNPKVMLRKFHAANGFQAVGVVIEKRL